MQTRLKISVIFREVFAVDCEVPAIALITISRNNALLTADKAGSFRTLILRLLMSYIYIYIYIYIY